MDNIEYKDDDSELLSDMLHKMGNALSSPKVTVASLMKSFEQSTIRCHIKAILSPLEEVLPLCDIPEEKRQQLLKVIKFIPKCTESEYQRNEEELRSIKKNIEELESLMDNCSRYIYLKADGKTISVDQVIKKAIATQDLNFKEKGISIEAKLEEVSVAGIQEIKLLQTFINVLENASESIHANKKTNKEIVVSSSLDPVNKQVVVKIKDSGGGFKVESQELFKYGYTTKLKSPYSGFGLHFCKHFLDSIGGQITAYNPGEGEGAEFSIYLQIGRAHV